eukprot:CAMPEP_0185326852 /NCGR_PEP_ID=MMETSP1363-20130426/69659_1 /TAXON_ID=38817 /ORGANISM="Gephyrocapsa oceanica, Strain RCC1303" /LENGTH=41 /DNA_ID= /DNA_START= /DNA_END= /DNA_ORIENTATION=
MTHKLFSPQLLRRLERGLGDFVLAAKPPRTEAGAAGNDRSL